MVLPQRPRSVVARVALAIALVAVPGLAASPAGLDAVPSPGAPVLSPGRAFVEVDGASLYANVCQGCHMPDGRGARGAADYPSLAADGNLQSPAFAITVVLNGLKAMPPIGRSMSDEQVAAVVTYVRSHFGNTFGAAVTAAADVKALRN